MGLGVGVGGWDWVGVRVRVRIRSRVRVEVRVRVELGVRVWCWSSNEGFYRYSFLYCQGTRHGTKQRKGNEANGSLTIPRDHTCVR